MTDVSTSPSPDDSTPWTQRGIILAAAFIAALVLLGLALLLVDTGGNDSTATDHGSNRQPSTNPPASTPTKDANASVCGLPAGDQQVPAAPPEAQWELVGTIAAPTEPKTGPGIKDGHRRLCFAHS